MQSGPTTRGFRLSMNMLKKARYALPTAAADGKDRLRPHAQADTTSAPRSARASPPSAVIDYPSSIKTLPAPNRTRKNRTRRDCLNYDAVPVTNSPMEATMSATTSSPAASVGSIDVNGVAVYYEQQGEGDPSSSFTADCYPVRCGRLCCLISPRFFG